jgi:hypothetical protein
MHARIYDHYSARFMSADPQFDATSDSHDINPYTYVINNPLIYTDPKGTHFHLGRMQNPYSAMRICLILFRFISWLRTFGSRYWA